MTNNSKEMARIACKALEEKKAEDIRIIDISEVSVIADYFIIADGSQSQSAAGDAGVCRRGALQSRVIRSDR